MCIFCFNSQNDRFRLFLQQVIDQKFEVIRWPCHRWSHLASFWTISLFESSAVPLLCSHFSSHTRVIFFIPYFIPESFVCLIFWLVNPPTVLLFFPLTISVCFSSHRPSFFSSPFLFSPHILCPRGKYGSDEHEEPGTNQSIDPSMNPLLCASDRQQKTKCLLSETFPVSLYALPHHFCSTISRTW